MARPLPHESWADLYDAVYERGYGSLYTWLTRVTLEQIAAAIAPPAHIVDFGAGTGRLAIPLAEAGHRVMAVEPVAEMLALLEEKTRAHGLEIETRQGRMSDFRSAPDFDLAICVFTVLLYIPDEDELRRSFRAVADCLKAGGRFLLDAPRREMFAGGVVRGEGVKRAIRITPRAGAPEGVFDYREETTVEVEDGKAEFSEAFPIRYWPREKVLAELSAVGLTLEKDLSALMKRSGCDYFLLRKRQ